MNSGILHHDDVELIDDQSEMLSRWPFLQTEDIQVVVLSENTFFFWKFHLFLWVVLSLLKKLGYFIRNHKFSLPSILPKIS